MGSGGAKKKGQTNYGIDELSLRQTANRISPGQGQDGGLNYTSSKQTLEALELITLPKVRRVFLNSFVLVQV
jgi:hypothetical protein